jgi:predicted amidohydrolase
VENVENALVESEKMLAVLQEAIRSAGNIYVAVSAVERVNGALQHVGVLLGPSGVVLRQPQLHICGRHPWIESLGNGLLFSDLPFGRAALVVGNDSIYPETFRLAALQDVEMVAVPTTLLEKWEMETGLLERAAENRLNVIVASRTAEVGTSAVIAISEDFTLWTEWKRPFEGNINYPQVTRANIQPGLTPATIYPAAAANHTISHRTNLVEGRPWQLAGPLLGLL